MNRFLLFIISVSFGSHSFSQIDSLVLNRQIDSLVNIGLDSMAYPGAQVVVMQNGNIIYQKAHGYHTYQQKTKVDKNDIYDLASISKISTGLPLLMKLYGEGRFDPKAKISENIPRLKNSNKAELIWTEVLTHQAGLVPWIPHWQNTIRKNKKFKSRTFQHAQTNKYSIRIANSLFLHHRYPKRMFRSIVKSKLNPDRSYLYSGIMFYLMPEMISEMVGKDFERYLYQNIYEPIGADNLRYLAYSNFERNRIIPTEFDSLFRKELVHGFVHDEGAAMLGGISCNAGLFGNATDLAKLGNLYAEMGILKGDTILTPESVTYFSTAHYADQGNRRGLAFDKPLLEPSEDDWIGPCAPSASSSSFGHSGFTGTYIWIDPEYKLVFVFLSNRVHPTRNNRKLYSLNLRQLMHQACYDSFLHSN